MYLVACGSVEEPQAAVLPEVATVTSTATSLPAPAVTVVPTMTAVPEPTSEATAVSSHVSSLVPEVVAVYEHDAAAFTQGLLWYDGGFYESTGLRGESSLRRVALDGTVTSLVPVDSAYFGEGLARVDDRLIQLTWQSGVALVYDRETLQEIGRFDYDGEGWGICYSPESGTLWMSDGSAVLTERDPGTFAILRTIDVLSNGEPVFRLNELECVGGFVYANVWQTDWIMQIEQESGRVSAVVDASQLLNMEDRASFSSNDVLNGIAYDAESQLFYLTGKRWPKLFAVRFIDVDE